ncbi:MULTISPECIES: hypothetical protein [Staphylococcus]|uniref:Protein VraC n=2 Tax=Staphylococcus xylosus TaxID=1288 RepID=A0A418IN18_STAXY|nr:MULTISPECIES: hypothetical protein [Staphylococcus]MDW8543913.1 hypothetical protein [Staphylococcus sp. KG4-1]MDW8561343.1 hypothetical protein [Staphylococcus sp. KG4-3]NQD98583.1 hypothetical protein [Staphylococcus xylosus]RIN10529.1 hypothetical protein BU097_08190 [Staphylococcus xylosus]
MQHYLNDGHEVREIIFNDKEANIYNQLFGDEPTNIVPTLLCAKLWPEFTLFQEFIENAILLKETEVTQIQPLSVNEYYLAHMYIVECKKVRQYMKYIVKLEINKNKYKCISITQTFLESI